MAARAAFRQAIKVALAGPTSPPEAGRLVGAFADAVNAALIESRQTSPVFKKYVDHVEGAPNEALHLPGTISYVHSSIAQAAAFALGLAVARSPVGSMPHERRYRDSWFFLVNGEPYIGAIERIPPGSTVTLTNKADYARKIDVGGQRSTGGAGIVEYVRQQTQTRFKLLGLEVSREFVTIPGGYVLKGRAYRSGLTYNSKTGVFKQSHPRRATNRADSRKGEVMTYPAVTIREAI